MENLYLLEWEMMENLCLQELITLLDLMVKLFQEVLLLTENHYPQLPQNQSAQIINLFFLEFPQMEDLFLLVSPRV
jgi:hypothetical protein